MIQHRLFSWRLWLPTLFCCTLFSQHLRAQTFTEVDPSFNFGQGAGFQFDKGFPRSAFAFGIANDGKFFIGGNFRSYIGEPVQNLVKVDPLTLKRDTSFNTSPRSVGLRRVVTLSTNFVDFQETPDGKVYVFGGFTEYKGTTVRHIYRLNPDGSLDNTFNPPLINSSSNPTIRKIHVRADGKVLICGTITLIGGVNRTSLALLNSDGTLDASFGAGSNYFDNSVSDMVVHDDGKITAIGNFTTVHGQPRRGIVRLNADGSLDNTFNPGTGFETNTAMVGIILQGGNRVVISHGSANYNGAACQRILRLLPNGNIDNSFALTANFSTTPRIVPMPDSTIIVFGNFFNYVSAGRSAVVKIEKNGALVTGFSSVGYETDISKIYPLANGEFYGLGSFPWIGNSKFPGIFKSDVNGIIYPSPYQNVGSARNFNQVSRHISGNKFYAMTQGGGLENYYNSTNIGRIISLNPDGSLDETFSTTNRWSPGNAPSSFAVTSDNKIIAGGAFNGLIGNSTYRFLAKLNTDGSIDLTFNGGVQGPNAEVVKVVKSGTSYFVVGSFTSYTGTPANFICKINEDGTLDPSFNFTAPPTGATQVRDLVECPDGKLLIVARGPSSTNTVMRLMPSGEVDNTFTIGTFASFSGINSFLYVKQDNSFYVFGGITSYSGISVPNLVHCNPDGSINTGFTPPNFTSGVVLGVQEIRNNRLMVYGNFLGVNSNSNYQAMAILNPDGTLDPNAFSTAENGINSHLKLDDDRAFLVGSFTTMGYKSTPSLAVVYIDPPCSTPATPTITAGGSTDVCAPATVTLQGPSIQSWETYLWSNGATTQNINVSVTGSYSLRIVSGGCTSAVSNTIDVTITTRPTTPTITAGGPTSLCDGGSVTLQGPAISGGQTYLWQPNGETTQNINVTVGGLYNLLVVAGICTSAVSNDIIVTVSTTPSTPTITADGPTDFCLGNSVNLQGPTISGGQTYLWSNGATTQNINVTESGTYSLRIVSGTCTTAVSNTINVTVNSTPVTPSITASGATTFCSGGSVTLQGPVISGGETYLWSNGETTQNINVTNTGSFTLRVVAGTCTSSVSNNITVTVSTTPSTPTITADGPTDFCLGNSVNLQGPSISGGQTYLWSNGATTQNINVTESGVYSLLVIAGPCTSSVSNTINVNVDNACPGNFIWNGTGTWTTASNWTPAFVPTPNSNITVQSGTLTVNGNYAINNLTVNMGSNLFIGGGSVLNIAGNAIVNGGSNANGGGEINLNGTGNQLLSSAGAGAWNIGTLRVSNNSGTVTLDRQLLIWRELILGNGSIFDLNGRSLTLKANATSRVTANLNMIAGNAQLLNTSGFWCEVAYPKSSIASGGSWVQTAPPVQGQQVRALQQKGNFPSIESYNAAIPASGSFYWFSNSFTTHPTNNGFYKPSDSTEAWPLGKGIRAWIRKVPADNGAFGYKGAPFTGNSFVINNLDYCTNNCAISDPNGLNLVGNPLAATINWDLLTRNHVEDAMYQYNHSQLIYATYIDGVGVNGGRKEIATGQGFFVHALQAGASITVPQTAVVPASTFAIFRSGAIEDLLRININLGDSSVDEMAIRLKDGATHNFDSRYDGRKMTGSGINIASIAEDGRRLSVDARPLTTGMIRIPLVMSRMNNLRNEELVFTGLESFNGKQVYLNHPSFDAPVQLTEGQRFTISPAYVTGLEVIINNSPQAIEGQLSNTFSLYPNPATENLTVSGINSGTVVRVLTVQGKEIIRQTLGAEGSLSVKALPQGLYFVEINGIKKTFVKQ